MFLLQCWVCRHVIHSHLLIFEFLLFLSQSQLHPAWDGSFSKQVPHKHSSAEEFLLTCVSAKFLFWEIKRKKQGPHHIKMFLKTYPPSGFGVFSHEHQPQVGKQIILKQNWRERVWGKEVCQLETEHTWLRLTDGFIAFCFITDSQGCLCPQVKSEKVAQTS